LSIISTAIKLIKYNLTDEPKFEILWNNNSKEQLHYCKSNPVKLTFRSKYIVCDDSSYLPWFQPKCDTIHLTEKKFYCMFNYRKKFLWNTNIEIYGTENSLVLIVASVKYNRRSEKNIAFFFFHINLRPGARTSCNKGVMQKLKRHGNGGSCLKKHEQLKIKKNLKFGLIC
jgi:hypothetical protein